MGKIKTGISTHVIHEQGKVAPIAKVTLVVLAMAVSIYNATKGRTTVYSSVALLALSIMYITSIWDNQTNYQWLLSTCIAIFHILISFVSHYSPDVIVALLWEGVCVIELSVLLYRKVFFHPLASLCFAIASLIPYVSLLSLSFGETRILHLGFGWVLEELSASILKKSGIASIAVTPSASLCISYFYNKYKEKKAAGADAQETFTTRQKNILYCKDIQKHALITALYVIIILSLLIAVLKEKTGQVRDWLHAALFFNIVPLCVGNLIVSLLRGDSLIKAELCFLNSNKSKILDKQTSCETEYKNAFIRKYCDVVSYVVCATGTAFHHDRVQLYKNCLLPLQEHNCDSRLIWEVLYTQDDLFKRFRKEFSDDDKQDIIKDTSIAISQLYKVYGTKTTNMILNSQCELFSNIRKHIMIVGICSHSIINKWGNSLPEETREEARGLVLFYYLSSLLKDYKDCDTRTEGQCLLVGLCSKEYDACATQRALLRKLLSYPYFAWEKFKNQYPQAVEMDKDGNPMECNWEATFIAFFQGIKNICISVDPSFWDSIDEAVLSEAIRSIPVLEVEQLQEINKSLDVQALQIKAREHIWSRSISAIEKTARELYDRIINLKHESENNSAKDNEAIWHEICTKLLNNLKSGKQMYK